MAALKTPARVIFTPKTEIKNAQTSTGGQLHNMKIKRNLKFIKYVLATAYIRFDQLSFDVSPTPE